MSGLTRLRRRLYRMQRQWRHPDTAGPLPRAQPLVDRVAAIPGWLNRITAIRTLDLLAAQTDLGITGNLLEIGVYCGKYFALLADAAGPGEVALGIDTFEFTSRARVMDELTRALGSEALAQVRLWKTSSTAVAAEAILAQIGRPRFISLDGAHDFATVAQDLALCDAVLAPDGLLSADDFLNPLTLGVNQAINAHLTGKSDLVPFAYVANKLFLCRPGHAATYRQRIEAAVMACGEPESLHFRSAMQHGRHHVEQPFFGAPVLLT